MVIYFNCTMMQGLTNKQNTNMSSFVAVKIVYTVIRKYKHSEVIHTDIQYAES
jgi:hypothetical protein